MEPLDGQVPAPRRAALRRRPAASPVELPFGTPVGTRPRVADLSALLGDIDALRLTLQTDLTLAAAALEADAAGLAVELVDSDLAELRAFGDRAADRLVGLHAGEAHTDAEVELPVDEVPAPVGLPRRRVLSAAPLMAAAAALIGFVAFVPDRGGLQSPETTMTSAAMAGWELNRLAREGAPDEALRLAAMELNEELAELIAQAATDPAAAQQALMLLDSTTQVLAGQDDSGVLRDVLAEARALRERLRETLPAVAQRAARPARTVVRTVPLVPPSFEQEPERQPSASAKASAAPSASPKPSPSATSSSPSPSASPEQSSPSPQPSEENEGPLSGTDSLPGL